MSKKDYVLIAATLKALPIDGITLHTVASALADALARDNVRFDRARFLNACGV
jgi:hypothetical protein